MGWNVDGGVWKWSYLHEKNCLFNLTFVSTLYLLIPIRKHKNIFTLSIIPFHWDCMGSWNASSWKARSLHCQHYGWWCPGDIRDQESSCHSIYNVGTHDILAWLSQGLIQCYFIIIPSNESSSACLKPAIINSMLLHTPKGKPSTLYLSIVITSDGLKWTPL